jgi:hypothetical protein
MIRGRAGTAAGLGLLIGLTALLAGCGYGFSGTVSYLPRELKTVAIPFPANLTGEPNIEIQIAQALIREFNRSKLLLLSSSGRADVILKGEVRSVTEGAVAYEDIRTALQRRIKVTVSMSLVGTADQKVYWRNQTLSEGQDFDVGSDPAATETNRGDALGILTRNLAEKIHDSIFENF